MPEATLLQTVPGSHERVQDRDDCIVAGALWVCLRQGEDKVCSSRSPSHHPTKREILYQTFVYICASSYLLKYLSIV